MPLIDHSCGQDIRVEFGILAVFQGGGHRMHILMIGDDPAAIIFSIFYVGLVFLCIDGTFCAAAE